MSYTIYNSITGAIASSSQVNGPPELLDNQSVIEQCYQGEFYYIDVDTKQGVWIPSPPRNGLIYNFNFVSKTYDLDIDASIKAIKALRDLGLSRVDRVNPVWYSSLTTEQQQELAAYRAALLDVPQQAGFPTDVNWPTKPTWL